MARLNEGSHSFTWHPYVYPQVEWTIPAFTAQPPSFTILQPVLISSPTEGRGLSWPGWLFNLFSLFSEPLWLADTGFLVFHTSWSFRHPASSVKALMGNYYAVYCTVLPNNLSSVLQTKQSIQSCRQETSISVDISVFLPALAATKL